MSPRNENEINDILIRAAMTDKPAAPQLDRPICKGVHWGSLYSYECKDVTAVPQPERLAAPPADGPIQSDWDLTRSILNSSDNSLPLAHRETWIAQQLAAHRIRGFGDGVAHAKAKMTNSQAS